MKKYLLTASLACSLFACRTEAAQSSFTLDAGGRFDSFKWNIAGNSSGTNPNILSELTWKDLEIFLVKAKADTASGILYIRGAADYGWILSGKNQDSDFNGDNRTLEFSRSNNGAGQGDVWDLSAGIGLKGSFAAGGGAIDIIPLVGYSYNRQDLRIIDGSQTIPATGPFAGLNSTYDAHWWGPWVGLDADYATKALKLYGTFEYHFADYKAEANWNLRADFAHPKSFEQTASGNGVVAGFGANYLLMDNLWLDGGFDYQRWTTGHGTDRTFFSNGTTSDTRFNEAIWDSYSVLVGLKYGL